MRNLFLKSMAFSFVFLLFVNMANAEEAKDKLDAAVAKKVQKLKLKEQAKKNLENLNEKIDDTKSKIEGQENKINEKLTALKDAMKALTGAGSNNFFNAAEAKEGDLSKALDKFLNKKEILNKPQLIRANQAKIDALETAIQKLRDSQSKSKINELKITLNQLEKDKAAIEEIPSVLDQDKDLEINVDEKNSDSKSEELANLNELIIKLYKKNEKTIEKYRNNEIAIARLVQIYSKYIDIMKDKKSLESIIDDGKKLAEERDEFLIKMGKPSPRGGIPIAGVGTIDLNAAGIKTSKIYKEIFKTIDHEIAMIEGQKDIPQTIRAFIAVQMGLLGIQKFEDSKGLNTNNINKPQASNTPSSTSFTDSAFLSGLLTRNPKDLKRELKRRRRNIHLYYKYR